jgi:hypothetical protein
VEVSEFVAASDQHATDDGLGEHEPLPAAPERNVGVCLGENERYVTRDDGRNERDD